LWKKFSVSGSRILIKCVNFSTEKTLVRNTIEKESGYYSDDNSIQVEDAPKTIGVIEEFNLRMVFVNVSFMIDGKYLEKVKILFSETEEKV
jgi:hypothetical protein